MRGRASRRLEQLARLLHAQRAPYYVRHPVAPGLEQTFPAAGWYWIPEGHHAAVYLGSSEVTATLALHRLIARANTEEPDGPDRRQPAAA